MSQMLTTMFMNVPFPHHTRRPCRQRRIHGRASQRSTMQKKFEEISISLDVCSESSNQFWHKSLEDHPDKHYRDTMYTYLNEGVHIGFKGPQESIISHNWPSCDKYTDVVQQFINKNKQLGSVQEPFHKKDLPANFRCSPLGAFKKRRSEKIRVVHDLSWPPLKSVNHYINKDNCTLAYITVDKAVKMCQKYEEAWMAETDLKDTFLPVPVHIDDNYLLGLSINNDKGETDYYDMASLPFGLLSSCHLFNMFAMAIEYMYKARVAPQDSDHLLDDIIKVEEQKNTCQASLDIITDTLHHAGFDEKTTKYVGPARSQVFLGLEVDAKDKIIKLHDERKSEIIDDLHEWKNRIYAIKRELLSIISKLQFCARVIRDGFKLICRLINISKRGRSLHHRIYITSEACADLRW